MEKKFLSTEMESFTDKHHVTTSKFSKTLDYMLKSFLNMKGQKHGKGAWKMNLFTTLMDL